jgi:hypothetical protein
LGLASNASHDVILHYLIEILTHPFLPFLYLFLAVWELFYLALGLKVTLVIAIQYLFALQETSMLGCTSHGTGECNAGKRYSLPNSRIMIHQPLGGAQGQETDLEIQVNLRSGIMPVLFLDQDIILNNEDIPVFISHKELLPILFLLFPT